MVLRFRQIAKKVVALTQTEYTYGIQLGVLAQPTQKVPKLSLGTVDEVFYYLSTSNKLLAIDI